MLPKHIKPGLPAGLCVAAGLLLTLNALYEYFTGAKSDFDVFSFAVGVYFLGKGLFIRSILDMLTEFKNNR